MSHRTALSSTRNHLRIAHFSTTAQAQGRYAPIPPPKKFQGEYHAWMKALRAALEPKAYLNPEHQKSVDTLKEEVSRLNKTLRDYSSVRKELPRLEQQSSGFNNYFREFYSILFPTKLSRIARDSDVVGARRRNDKFLEKRFPRNVLRDAREDIRNVTAVFNNLVQASPSLLSGDWELKVIEDAKHKNAHFYVKSRRLVFSTGYLAVAKTDGDVAETLGHEFAHGICRHDERIQNIDTTPYLWRGELQYREQILGLSDHTGILRHLLAIAPQKRRHEYEADYYGILLAMKAGYQCSKEFLERRKDLDNRHWDEYRRYDKIDRMLYDLFVFHPPASSRVRAGAQWRREFLEKQGQ